MTFLRKRLRHSCECLLAHSPEEIRKLIEPYSHISFDVFDTLVFRVVGDPEEVFEIVGKQLDFQDVGYGSYVEFRRRAEAIARKRTVGEEINYADIFRELERLLPDMPPAFIRGLANQELKTERETLRARECMRAIFEYARSCKQVSLISDMYLARAFLEDVLIDCGYCLDGVGVYISSEYGLTKRSGNLFRKATDGEFGDCCHVGDNLIADWLAPRKLGMRAFLVHTPSASIEAFSVGRCA